jgi:drug/metabolite transporter (DMT)-like permease
MEPCARRARRALVRRSRRVLTRRARTAVAVLVYVLCSSTMLVINKVCRSALCLRAPCARACLRACVHACRRAGAFAPRRRCAAASLRVCAHARSEGHWQWGACLSARIDPPPHPAQAAMNALPFSNTVSALQTGVGAVMLYICRSAGAIEQFPAPTASKVAGWSPVVMVWIVPIALNMAAMRYLTVETLMMFRSVTIVLVAVGDYLVLGNALQPRQQVACAIISVGGIIYASHDISFHLVGYLLGAAYSVAMLVNSIYTKFAFNQNKSMTTWEKSFLNNLVATPVMLVCVAAMEDVGKMQNTVVSMTPLQATCVALSCVMGLGISMSGIKCR